MSGRFIVTPFTSASLCVRNERFDTFSDCARAVMKVFGASSVEMVQVQSNLCGHPQMGQLGKDSVMNTMAIVDKIEQAFGASIPLSNNQETGQKRREFFDYFLKKYGHVVKRSTLECIEIIDR